MQEIIDRYISLLQEKGENGEKFKWEAIDNFQNIWNIDASDFNTMFRSAFRIRGKLFFQNSWGFISHAVKHFPEDVRLMFRNLYNEGVDLEKRILKFQESAKNMLPKLTAALDKTTFNDQQDERSISVYLSFRYPEKYYIYMYTFYENYCNALKIQMASDNKRYLHYLKLANQLRDNYLRGNVMLDKLHKSIFPNTTWNSENVETQNILFLLFLEPDFCNELLAKTSISINMVNTAEQTINPINVMENNLNQILFGPPGTGKTFQTINEALKITDPEFYKINKGNRGLLKKRFRELTITDWDKTNGQIVFCTFHQSFSYEDFVEGIKPLKPKDEDQFIKYDIVPGVFKNICTLSNDYEKSKQIQSNPLVSLSEFEFNKAIFYKLSLGDIQDPNDNEIYDYCIKNNCISIGFGDGVDFSGLNETEITKRCTELNLQVFHSQALNFFIHYMKVGNYVIIGKGNRYVRALGKIRGAYHFDAEAPIRHKNFREVEWIFTDENIPISEIYDRNLSQMTIYKLDEKGIQHDFFVKTPKPVLQFEKQEEKKDEKKFVLIIDEINRGNISSIFGELITLIEKDKRSGAKEELEVILPYSKEPFKVPANVHIIGTMNTADRSIEALDTALRRRFSFAEIAPDAELIKKEGKLAPDGLIDDIDVVKMLDVINFRIEKLIDKDHKIGHAYFLHIEKSKQALEDLFADKIIPLLEEYFFGDFGKIGLVLGESFVEKVSMNGFDFATFPAYGEMVTDLKEKSVYRIKSKDKWDFASI